MHFCINIYCFTFSPEAIVLPFSKNNLLMYSLVLSKHCSSSSEVHCQDLCLQKIVREGYVQLYLHKHVEKNEENFLENHLE